MATSLSASPPDAATQSATVNSSQTEWLALSSTQALAQLAARSWLNFLARLPMFSMFHSPSSKPRVYRPRRHTAIGTGRSIELAHEQVAKATAAGIKLVTLDEAEYPARLRQIYDPPLVL